MTPLRIAKIGFEIEGEFSVDLRRQLSEFGLFKPDGSIRECRHTRQYQKNHCNSLCAEEFVSRPYRLDNRLDKAKLKELFSILERGRKYKYFHWNASMGFHVHVSFNRVPVEIWSIQFYDFFRAELSRQFRGVVTRRENNRFCRLPNERSNQDIAFSESRYYGVNFKPAFESHGTIEFRIFPAAAPRTLKRYLQFTCLAIKRFKDEAAETALRHHEEGELEKGEASVRKYPDEKVSGHRLRIDEHSELILLRDLVEFVPHERVSIDAPREQVEVAYV